MGQILTDERMKNWLGKIIEFIMLPCLYKKRDERKIEKPFQTATATLDSDVCTRIDIGMEIAHKLPHRIVSNYCKQKCLYLLLYETQIDLSKYMWNANGRNENQRIYHVWIYKVSPHTRTPTTNTTFVAKFKEEERTNNSKRIRLTTLTKIKSYTCNITSHLFVFVFVNEKESVWLEH